MTRQMKDAIAYARENIDREEIVYAIFKMDKYRCPLRQTGTNLDMKISDLMEEYSADNDLPEGWWLEEMDIDDIIFEL